jgi:hypothetical protein
VEFQSLDFKELLAFSQLMLKMNRKLDINGTYSKTKGDHLAFFFSSL